MAASVRTEIREQAVKLVVENGLTLGEAAKRCGVGEASIARWLQRHRAGEGLAPRAYKRGKPPILNEQDGKLVLELIQQHPQATIRDLTKMVAQQTGKPVAEPTLIRCLRRLGVHKVRPKRVPRSPADPGAPRYGYSARHRDPDDRTRYPSSLTDGEWELVQDLFVHDGAGHPEVYTARVKLDAILYVLRSGCPWRMLPHEFPPWNGVYKTFRRWHAASKFETMHDRLRGMERKRVGRNVEPTGGIVDTQSVKTSEKGGPKVLTVARRSRDASAISSQTASDSC